MTNNKGELRKKCPFLGSWCIGDACALFIQITQTGVSQLGIVQAVQQGMCSFPALCLIASPKPQPQQVKLSPHLFNKG